MYYGEEIEFMKAAPQDIIGNDDTLSSTGRAYFGDHLTEVVVGLAIGSDQHVCVDGIRAGVYQCAVTGRELHGTNQLEFDVPANSAGIYVWNGSGRIIGDGSPYLR